MMNVLYQYLAALAASIGAFCAGCVLGWSAPASKLLNETTSSYDFSVTETDLSWLGSVIGLGAASVCLIGGTMIDLVGRKMTMILMLFPFSIGWGLVIFAKNVTCMIVGRLFLGIACGGICVSAPMYTGEISHKNIRGILGSFFQLMITLGILFVYVFGAPEVSVFTFSAICGGIPFIFGLCILLCPESPTYWIKKGKNEKAAQSLRWLRGPDFDYADEIAELVKEEESKRDQNFMEAIRRKSSVKGLIVTNGLMFFQQMCGINAVIFFQTKIFEDAGVGLEPWISTIIVGVVQVVATSVSTLTLDRVGRRLLLLISGLVMAICTSALGLFFVLNKDNSASHLGWLPVTAVCIFIVAFSAGYGPVPWVILGEMFAPDVKGVAGSVAATLNWVLAFAVGKTFKDLNEAVGTPFTFFTYSILSLVGLIFVIFVVPETKGKSLSEIQEMLEEN